MTYLTAVGITVGLLAGGWVYLSGVLGLIGFAGFLGWAAYFAAGGSMSGAKSALITGLSGVLWGVVTVAAGGLLPSVPSLVFTVLFAAVMCWQARFSPLGFIPGTFIGNAAFYAAGSDPTGAAIALVCGVLLGVLSDVLAKYISKRSVPADSDENL